MLTRIRSIAWLSLGFLTGAIAVFMLADPSRMRSAVGQEVPKVLAGPRYQLSSWARGAEHGAYIIDSSTGDLFSVNGENGPNYLKRATTRAGKSNENANLKDSDALVGTWKLTSSRYNGQDFAFPAGISVVKHLTPGHFVTMIYDEAGKVQRAAGGSYVIDGDSYKETPEYSTSENFGNIKNITQSFTSKLEGNTWRYSGKLSIGMEMEEVYVRVGKE
jgi:hypothetical protein